MIFALDQEFPQFIVGRLYDHALVRNRSGNREVRRPPASA